MEHTHDEVSGTQRNEHANWRVTHVCGEANCEADELAKQGVLREEEFSQLYGLRE